MDFGTPYTQYFRVVFGAYSMHIHVSLNRTALTQDPPDGLVGNGVRL